MLTIKLEDGVCRELSQPGDLSNPSLNTSNDTPPVSVSTRKKAPRGPLGQGSKKSYASIPLSIRSRFIEKVLENKISIKDVLCCCLSSTLKRVVSCVVGSSRMWNQVLDVESDSEGV